jgi:uncharacterized protein YjiS (DUF1127 family)
MSSTTITPVFASRHSEGLMTRLNRTVRVWLVARRTRAALLKLSVRELDDVGLAPGDIDRVARRVAAV